MAAGFGSSLSGDGDGDGVIDAMTLTLGAAMTYPHKTRQERPTLDNTTLDKIKPTLRQDKTLQRQHKTRFSFFLACYVHAFFLVFFLFMNSIFLSFLTFSF